MTSLKTYYVKRMEMS